MLASPNRCFGRWHHYLRQISAAVLVFWLLFAGDLTLDASTWRNVHHHFIAVCHQVPIQMVRNKPLIATFKSVFVGDDCIDEERCRVFFERLLLRRENIFFWQDFHRVLLAGIKQPEHMLTRRFPGLFGYSTRGIFHEIMMRKCDDVVGWRETEVVHGHTNIGVFGAETFNKYFANAHIRPQSMLASVASFDQKADSNASQNPRSYGNPLFGTSAFQAIPNSAEKAFGYFIIVLASAVALGGAAIFLGLMGDGGIALSILLWIGCLWAVYHGLQWVGL